MVRVRVKQEKHNKINELQLLHFFCYSKLHSIANQNKIGDAFNFFIILTSNPYV
jgi:hypothetical protein